MKRPTADLLRAWLRTHGNVITREEATRLGVTAGELRHLTESGALVAVHHGVYQDAASPRSPLQATIAAYVAAAPSGAVVSHATAAWLWALTERPPGAVHLTVPVRANPLPRSVVVHRSRDLDPSRTVWHQGVACTDPLRTLADLGACAGKNILTQAVDRALALRLVTVTALQAEVDRVRRAGRRGPGALRAVLLERGFVGAPAPSVLESRALRLFRQARIPITSCEQRAGPEGEYWLDFAVEPWRGGAKVAIETHGYVWHFSPEHQRRDLARQRRLTLTGWRYLAYTWRDLASDPDAVTAEIWTAIRQRREGWPA